MSGKPTTISLQPDLRKLLDRKAVRLGLSLNAVINMMLRAQFETEKAK